MKLQTLHEARQAGSERVPYLSRLFNLLEEVKSDITQEETIKFVAYLEAKNIHENMGLKDMIWLVMEGMEGLNNNPKAADEVLETYVDPDYPDEMLKELVNDAKKFFGIS
jgi:hypothetical protein